MAGPALTATSVALRAHMRILLRSAALIAGAVLSALGAAGFLVAALFLWLLPPLGAAAAAALTGLVLLAVAGLIYGAFCAWRGRRIPAPDPAAALALDVVSKIRANPLEAVLLALGAGFTAGGARRG